MVVVGLVIENKGKWFEYFDRFNTVFKSVKASPFHKTPLFDTYKSQIKVFNDRVVFVYSGVITAFSLVMRLLMYSVIIMLMVFIVFAVNGFFLWIAVFIIQILIITGMLILATYHFTYSKYGFWLGHKRTFRKKKFNLGQNKKKLLTEQELIDCFIWEKKPLFKNETGLENE